MEGASVSGHVGHVLTGAAALPDQRVGADIKDSQRTTELYVWWNVLDGCSRCVCVRVRGRRHV